jgi:hypothetical protein
MGLNLIVKADDALRQWAFASSARGLLRPSRVMIEVDLFVF